jgi:hypothetical protein
LRKLKNCKNHRDIIGDLRGLFVGWLFPRMPTMEKLLPYYERELSMLRRAGAEFAGRYPKLAGSLQLRGESCADPRRAADQASAFLNARVAKLLDDGHDQFTERCLACSTRTTCGPCHRARSPASTTAARAPMRSALATCYLVGRR